VICNVAAIHPSINKNIKFFIDDGDNYNNTNYYYYVSLLTEHTHLASALKINKS